MLENRSARRDVVGGGHGGDEHVAVEDAPGAGTGQGELPVDHTGKVPRAVDAHVLRGRLYPVLESGGLVHHRAVQENVSAAGRSGDLLDVPLVVLHVDSPAHVSQSERAVGAADRGVKDLGRSPEAGIGPSAGHARVEAQPALQVHVSDEAGQQRQVQRALQSQVHFAFPEDRYRTVDFEGRPRSAEVHRVQAQRPVADAPAHREQVRNGGRPFALAGHADLGAGDRPVHFERFRQSHDSAERCRAGHLAFDRVAWKVHEFRNEARIKIVIVDVAAVARRFHLPQRGPSEHGSPEDFRVEVEFEALVLAA